MVNHAAASRIASGAPFWLWKVDVPEMRRDVPQAVRTDCAAEIRPARSVDGFEFGSGGRPITRKLQSALFGLFAGETEDEWGWLDPIG